MLPPGGARRLRPARQLAITTATPQSFYRGHSLAARLDFRDAGPLHPQKPANSAQSQQCGAVAKPSRAGGDGAIQVPAVLLGAHHRPGVPGQTAPSSVRQLQQAPGERLTTCEGAARPAWRMGPEPRPMTERGSGGARRQLFTDVRHLQSPEGGNMRLFTYTPLLRSHSFSYAHPPRIRNRYSSASDDNRNSREPGDLDVRVECFSATPSGEWRVPEHEANHRSAVCRRIDLHIQNILESHRQMRPSTNTYGELDRWRSQEAEVLRLTEEASCLIDKLSEHHRVVYDVTNGSVLIRINCQTLLGVLDLWQLYQSGTLHGLVNELFGGDKLLDDLQVRDAMFRVRVCPRQYKQCLQELGSSVLLYLQPSTTARPLNIIKKASSCSSAENILTTAPCSPASGRFSQSAHVLSTSSPAATSSWNTKSPSTPPWNTKSPSTPPWNTKSPSTPPWNTKAPSTPPWNIKSPSTPPWNARSSTPTSREGKFLYGDLVPRKAFSELNLSDGETPASPTKKKSSFDSLSQKENSGWSPLHSPRLCTTASQGRRRKADTDCEESSEICLLQMSCHAQQLPTDQ
ncbi:uncharacterized protein LOC112556745 isoform X1 [Pomacea canaliculata]|uniref:uncharacterized protein LOC112556745 isoform X1 n=1 Tax=Pomacea canaliculata TaxID=400727 RepID=UPI000D737694|nr:uncharacterized protein LOC112556745 isoform X1 [Pomacea canaliculata]XP_025081832.1 uncharacterized protein LOC112556745 isoform X1 [Pomacea canaliculata]XP_025081833.1 uncharacterized protein LOC112556745 isoform X1 [Pomacea canaliculata]